MLRAIQMVFQNPDATLNPAWSAGAILSRAVDAWAAFAARPAARASSDLARRVRFEPQHLEARPGELVRWPEAAHRDRPRLRRPSHAGRVRRARLGSRRLGAGEPSSTCSAELQAGEGISYIFISHDLAVVRYLSDHIAVMYLGKLMEDGEAETVFTPPQHPYTEALDVGDPHARLRAGAARASRCGAIPSLSDPPSGAVFTRAATDARGRSASSRIRPGATSADGHSYRCHIEPGELERLQRGRLAAR